MNESSYELSNGYKVPIEAGGEAIVKKELGRGGQGIVYLVNYKGKDYALKWYFLDKMKNPDPFRKNLAKNIMDGPPSGSDKFLWPQHLTSMVTLPSKARTYGYLMDLAPADYVELDLILAGFKYVKPDRKGQNAKKITYKFKTLEAQVNAAINIVNAFRTLHLVGKSYQDLNGGGFYINLDNGDVVICDCDNVAPDGENFGIGGFPGYMAPEIVRGVAKPDVLTDRYSLAVVLFRLFMRADPLEGKKVLASVVLTEAKDLEHYGKNPVFIYDKENASNRPVNGVHMNAISLWPLYPSYIREAFETSFTEGMKDPGKRLIEKTWQSLLVRLRSEIVHCYCGKVAYSNAFKHHNNFVCECRECHGKIYTLQVGKELVPLYPGLKLYKCHTEQHSEDYNTVTAQVVENRNKKGVYGLRNLSERTWKTVLPNGDVKEIPPMGAVPIWPGLQIDFTNGIAARLVRKPE